MKTLQTKDKKSAIVKLNLEFLLQKIRQIEEDLIISFFLLCHL